MRTGVEVDTDRSGTAALRGRPRRARRAGATPARVIDFPGGRLVPPESEQLVRVGGRTLLVRRSGAGSPLLLLPGMGMPLTAWGPLLPQLRGFECIAVALPGSGGFVGRHPVPTMDGFAELVRGLLDRLDIATADVLGLSFGGLVAQQLAHDAPTRVRGLILVSTSCGLGGIPNNPVNWWGAMLSGAWSPSWLRPAPRFVDHWPVQLLRRIGIGGSTMPRLTGLAEQLTAASLWSSLPWLSSLPQQTLVITGTADAVMPAANAAILASGIPAPGCTGSAGAGTCACATGRPRWARSSRSSWGRYGRQRATRSPSSADMRVGNCSGTKCVAGSSTYLLPGVRPLALRISFAEVIASHVPAR